MSAFRELMKKGNEDMSSLSPLEFVLYVSGKNTKGSAIDSGACDQFAKAEAVIEAARAYLEHGFTSDREKLHAALREYDYIKAMLAE